MEIELPRHDCSLAMEHNPHKMYYQTVKEFISRIEEHLETEWENEESKKRAIETNELWEMRWYPDTPMRFNLAYAPTFQELLDFVNSKHG